MQLTVLEQATATGARYTLAPGEDSPSHLLGREAPRPDRLATALRYVRLGYEHIVPGERLIVPRHLMPLAEVSR